MKKCLKKHFFFIFIFLFLSSVFSQAFANSQRESSYMQRARMIMMDSVLLHTGRNYAYVKNTREQIHFNKQITVFALEEHTFLPLGFILEKLGYDFFWNEELQSATLHIAEKVIEINPEDRLIKVDREIVVTDFAFQVKEGILFLPSDLLADLLDVYVWKDPRGTVAISAIDHPIDDGSPLMDIFEGFFSPTLEDVELLVKPFIVRARILKNTHLYTSSDLRKVSGAVSQGDSVEILQDRGTMVYQVRELSNNTVGWVRKEILEIPPDFETNQEKMTPQEIEFYVNEKGFESQSAYFIWTDLHRQVVHIFTKEDTGWKLLKTFSCASGKNISPTTRGTYTISDRGDWFYTDRFRAGAKYWVRFNGAYLFHTLSMDKNKNVIDPTLGSVASSGCIRLSIEDAKWIYDHIPNGTTVYIH